MKFELLILFSSLCAFLANWQFGTRYLVGYKGVIIIIMQDIIALCMISVNKVVDIAMSACLSVRLSVFLFAWPPRSQEL